MKSHLWSAYGTNRLRSIGVNGDTEPARLKEGIQNYGITWRSFRNKVGNAQSISEKWNIGGWPTLYLIDQTGMIRNRWTDTVPPEELNREVDAVIAGKSEPIRGIGSLLPTGRVPSGSGLQCSARSCSWLPQAEGYGKRGKRRLNGNVVRAGGEKRPRTTLHSAATQKIGRPRPVQLLWSLDAGILLE